MSDSVKVVQEAAQKIIHEYKNSIRKLQNTLVELIKPIMVEGGINSIRWCQYTPYFNDGDVCTFRAGIDDLYVEPVNQDMERKDIWELDKDSTMYHSAKTIVNILAQLNNSIFLTMFGDHKEVIIYANGSVESTRYDHD